MPLMDDGSGPYTLGSDGEKRYATVTEFSMNDEPVYRFAPATGILEISISETDIPLFVEAIGGLPAKEVILPSPPPLHEECHFHDVKEIKSLPKKDGSFFIKISESREDGNYQSLSVYHGSKSRCDNCSRDFTDGEVISVDEFQGLVFCYSDARGGCVQAYVFSSGKMAAGTSMRFGTKSLPSEQRIPNYPNSPIVAKEDKTKQKNWLKKLLRL